MEVVEGIMIVKYGDRKRIDMYVSMLFWRTTLKIHIMSDLLAKAMAGCI